MDANTPSGRQAAQPPGGTVEPANRAAVAKARFQTPLEQPGERYELRDPFAEVTYRTSQLGDMVAKAQQLGSTRFTAVDAKGTRTPIEQVDGAWQRGIARARQAERPLDDGTVRDQPAQSRSATGPAAPAQAMTKALNPSPAKGDAQPEAQRQQQPQVAPSPQPDALAKLEAQAERTAQVARLQAALQDRYLIKRAPVTVGDVTIGRTEYRFKGDTARVAFTESTFKLATDTNNPSVARSMVDVAEARNWKALRVSGNEDFKRLVWLEASVRGVKAQGYEPSTADQELLKKEREARQVNRIEPMQAASPSSTQRQPGTPSPDQPKDGTAGAAKASQRGGGGRKAVLAAIDAVLVARQVPDKQREAVMAAATEQLAQRLKTGPAPQVRLYDKSAPSQRQPAPAVPDPQRQNERPAPMR